MKFWYRKSFLGYLLSPLGYLYGFLMAIRSFLYKRGIKKSHSMPRPVIIVGNISVGGVGKTPLLIALYQLLKQEGYTPGVVSRGFGAKSKTFPQIVNADSSAEFMGDEPVLIARKTGAPVVIDPIRSRACHYLLDHFSCDVILSDDGLQHLALKRDIEIAVVDPNSPLGNGFCLPAGPLRELPRRLRTVDVVTSSDKIPSAFVNIKTGKMVDLTAFSQKNINAVAGIGQPQQFFEVLRKFGCHILPHVFPDHYAFCSGDLELDNHFPMIMTEKDAIKCETFATDNMWYLDIHCKLSESVKKVVLAKLATFVLKSKIRCVK